MGALFGLLSALSIGCADLFGRKVARVSSAVTTAAAMSVIAIGSSALATALFGSSLRTADFLIGAVSGLGLGVGLATYYVGMVASSSTVVSPTVAALSAIIPFLYALSKGASPSAFAVLGAGVALAGLLLITIGGGGARRIGVGLLWGLLSGVAYGVGFAVVIEASDSAGAWPAVGQRVAASALMIAVALRSSAPVVPPVGARGWALAGGTLAGLSTVFYLVGVRADATAAVITTSMFPAASVAIGRTVFGDPVSRLQAIGIAVVLVGVIALAVG